MQLARKKRAAGSSDARAALGLSDDADENDAAAAYKRLARELHPDKGGDRERFLAVVDAYEALTGREHRPYGDLYRSVCVDVVGACASEEDVEASKRFFPRYDGSAKFPRATKRRKRRRRKERYLCGTPYRRRLLRVRNVGEDAVASSARARRPAARGPAAGRWLAVVAADDCVVQQLHNHSTPLSSFRRMPARRRVRSRRWPCAFR